jgi:hypothetical protein
MIENYVDFKPFDTREEKDMEIYKELLNNPLVVILQDENNTQETTHFDDSGKPIKKETYVVKLVKWKTMDL